MSKLLTPAQLQSWRDKGYANPFTAFDARLAQQYRDKLQALERHSGGKLPDDRQRKMHLYLQWVDEIVHNRHVLDAVEDLVGPDILLYHITLWSKDAHTASHVSWHQDSTYFGLNPAEHVTAWLALSDSNMLSGCVQVLPGSHLRGQARHKVGVAQANMLRGQELDVPEDAQVEIMEVRPGQFSLHHTYLHHNSMPNRSDDRRIGLGISYIPTRCACSARQRLSAMLVRGVDRFGHFDLEKRPTTDMAPEGLADHAEAMRRWHAARDELIAQAHAETA